MDANAGRFFEADEERVKELRAALPGHTIEQFSVGERVVLKGCWFEVTAIKTHKRQRLVLKPIPAPADPAAEGALRDALERDRR